MGDHEEAARAFGARVRQAREALKLSQEGLADEAGLHRTYIGSIERGERNVSLVNILRIADALHVPPGQLLDGISSNRGINATP
ncbi:hypothetical protein ALI22I_01380 [Saccharothrix sp. ALI-22-I]|uniref:helix-turn-helix domain-containing protein n=1 Tax=Saccharothrix sp. ALI-22-I TaxID=1933778 RepID=UPI00097C7B63|nr:helix-turn-helix transcriptional regulator [Saccharothrix sp. ALI-22-I]ONI92858.1 hypothetical protein ALI22I_01380 [Saccharothrix sp. ALI-22-I]